MNNEIHENWRGIAIGIAQRVVSLEPPGVVNVDGPQVERCGVRLAAAVYCLAAEIEPDLSELEQIVGHAPGIEIEMHRMLVAAGSLGLG